MSKSYYCRVECCTRSRRRLRCPRVGYGIIDIATVALVALVATVAALAIAEFNITKINYFQSDVFYCPITCG